MSAPKLVLLTGPAAGEVAGALDLAECERCDVSMDPCSLCPVRLDFEVRDFLEVPRKLIPSSAAGGNQDLTAGIIAQRACSLPGGEAWLVGLVLPDRHAPNPETTWEGLVARHNRAYSEKWRLPARLAILAPEPPPLLVERVEAWGGDRWECEWSPCPGAADDCCIVTGKPIDAHYAKTWPEVVRAALGEVAVG